MGKTFNWEPHYNRILAMEARGLSQSEIAAAMSDYTGEEVTRDMVRHALPRAMEAATSLHDMPHPDRIPYVTKYLPYLTGEKKPEPKNWGLRTDLLNKANAKILHHADLHIPFHDEEKIQETFEKHRDADCYICTADVMDVYEHSFFDKGMSMPFEFEMDETLRFLEYISEHFPLCELLESNHEDRVRRVIEKNLPTSLQFLASKNILEVLARPFPNILVHSNMWFFQQGTVLYCHPTKGSRVELKVPVDVYDHFVEWGGHYNLPEWDTVIVAHTHAASNGYMSRAKIMESACLSLPGAYAYSPKIPYKHPQRNGYIIVTLNKGKCNWNETREYVWGIEPMRGN